MTTTFNTGIVIYNDTPLSAIIIERLILPFRSNNEVGKVEYLQDCHGFKQFIIEIISPFEPTDEHSLYKHTIWVEFASQDLATLAKLGAP